jgi:hypothetical protein
MIAGREEGDTIQQVMEEAHLQCLHPPENLYLNNLEVTLEHIDDI